MDNTNTVTIPIEEYFDLREKANMNTYLLREFSNIESRFTRLDERIWEIERKIDNG